MTRMLTILLGLVLAADVGFAAQKPEEDRLIQGKCAVYSSEIEQAKMHAPALAADPQIVSRPSMKRELLLMEDRDQRVRNPISISADGQIDPAVSAQVAAVDAANLQRFRHIMRQDGFPTLAMVGRDGVEAAWRLVQHADSDPDFQASILKVLKPRVRRGEVKSQNVALLTDRVLRAQHKPQRYGSQFEYRGHELVPQPIEDEAHVDERRREVGLPSMKAYACMLRAVYGLTNNETP